MSTESKKAKRDRNRQRRQRRAAKLGQERTEHQRTAAEMARLKAENAAAGETILGLRDALETERNRSQLLTSQLEGAQADVARLAASNVAPEERLRAAEARARDRDELAAKVARFETEDRDVAKLRRRLQERAATLEETRRQLASAKARIPPRPFVVGKATGEAP